MYAYCGNNPVINSDVSGNMCVSDGDGNLTEGRKQALLAGYLREYQIQRDWKNFDIHNSDPEKVVQSYYFSAYKGIVYIKVPGYFGLSFGVVFIGDEVDAEIVKHEYGHTRQLFQMGAFSYLVNVAIPSVVGYVLKANDVINETIYYSLPWEYQANILGQVNDDEFKYHPSVNKYYARYSDYLFIKRISPGP